MPLEIVAGAAAHANVVGLPANVLIYAGPGFGKTTDAVATFCRGNECTAFTIYCEDGALKAPAARGLPVPAHPTKPVKSWADMAEAFGWLSANRQNFSGLIIDGFSVFSTHLYREAESTLAKEKNKFAIPLLVRGQLLAIREWIRLIGLHTVLTAHPLPPAVQDGVFYEGGFALQPKTIIGEFFGQIDTVLRGGFVSPLSANPLQPSTPVRAYFTGGTDWPAQVQQPADWRFWRTKNREGCNDAIVPGDTGGLGAFLRKRLPPYGGL